MCSFVSGAASRPFCLCSKECLSSSSSQGLPGPPGEKGENGDVGPMVSCGAPFCGFFSVPAIRIVFTYSPERWEIVLIVPKVWLVAAFGNSTHHLTDVF